MLSFTHLHDQQQRYHTYVREERDDEDMMNLVESVKATVRMISMAGFNAMVKKWLMEDCPFPAEEFVEIIRAEYGKDISVLL